MAPSGRISKDAYGHLDKVMVECYQKIDAIELAFFVVRSGDDKAEDQVAPGPSCSSLPNQSKLKTRPQDALGLLSRALAAGRVQRVLFSG